MTIANQHDDDSLQFAEEEFSAADKRGYGRTGRC